MSDIDNGGSAFPYVETGECGVRTGMTLRDYFAAHADVSIYSPFETLSAKLGHKPTVGELAEYIANVRCIEADAVLKVRNK